LAALTAAAAPRPRRAAWSGAPCAMAHGVKPANTGATHPPGWYQTGPLTHLFMMLRKRVRLIW
jgi:hypothetical protein